MATHQVKLAPFAIPKSVMVCMPPGDRSEGFKPAPAIPLSDLSIETITELCREFTAAVMEEHRQQVTKILNTQQR